MSSEQCVTPPLCVFAARRRDGIKLQDHPVERAPSARPSTLPAAQITIGRFTVTASARVMPPRRLLLHGRPAVSRDPFMALPTRAACVAFKPSSVFQRTCRTSRRNTGPLSASSVRVPSG